MTVGNSSAVSARHPVLGRPGRTPATMVPRSERLRCAACAGPLTGVQYVALTGEVFCTRHAGERSCVCCGLPEQPDLDRAVALCRRCAATSVRTQPEVKRVLPPITAQLRALGIATTRRVRVRLADASEIDHAFGGNPHVLGATLASGVDVIDLMIRRDLPAIMFGCVVAHETMHVYLAQQNFGDLPDTAAEGLCELLAYAWARRQDGVLAAAQRRQIEENPDPVYGDGFRQAKAAVARFGVRRTLDHLKKHQVLPTALP